MAATASRIAKLRRPWMSARFVRKTIIKHADLVRPGRVALCEERSVRQAEIILRLLTSANEFDSHAALAEIGLEYKRFGKNARLEFAAEIWGQKNIFGFSRFRFPACDQFRLRSELRAGGEKFLEHRGLGFADESAGEDSGIGRRGRGQTAMLHGEPQAINRHRRIKHPRRPEFPLLPAPNSGGEFAAIKIRDHPA